MLIFTATSGDHFMLLNLDEYDIEQLCVLKNKFFKLKKEFGQVSTLSVSMGELQLIKGDCWVANLEKPFYKVMIGDSDDLVEVGSDKAICELDGYVDFDNCCIEFNRDGFWVNIEIENYRGKTDRFESSMIVWSVFD